MFDIWEEHKDRGSQRFFDYGDTLKIADFALFFRLFKELFVIFGKLVMLSLSFLMLIVDYLANKCISSS